MSIVRIRMRTLAAGPEGVLLSGETYEIDERIAAPLITGGYAERIGASEPGDVETAQLPEGETAAAPKRPRKPRPPRP